LEICDCSILWNRIGGLTFIVVSMDTAFMSNSGNYGSAVMAMCMCMECGPVRLVPERQMR
jgi:hypothetical protein